MSAVDEMDRQDGIIACTPQAVGELVAEIRRLEADNERLRAALRLIAGFNHSDPWEYRAAGIGLKSASCCIQRAILSGLPIVAQCALEQKP